MGNKDLLKPRYKVIADYPDSNYKIGDLLCQDKSDTTIFFKSNDVIERPERWPHLFKKLEWWEDRQPEDMPEYVKHSLSGSIEPFKGIKMFRLQFFLPATKEEYENQK